MPKTFLVRRKERPGSIMLAALLGVELYELHAPSPPPFPRINDNKLSVDVTGPPAAIGRLAAAPVIIPPYWRLRAS